MRLHAWLLSMIALATSAQAGTLARETARFPELPPPPGGSTQWIARSMRMNGLAMTLKSFQSRLPAEAVLSHYESWSKGRGHAERRRSRSADGQLLSLKFEPYIVTIRAHASEVGTIGTIVVSRHLEVPLGRAETRFPRPSSTTVVNLQQFEDEGAEAEHISVISHRAPHVEAQAFAQVLQDEDWVIIRKQPMQEVARGHLIEAQKGTQLAYLTIFPHQGSSSLTATVIVWKKV